MIKKKYHFKLIAIICIIVFSTLGVIMIYQHNQVGKFYTLQEAYDNGYLTEENLQVIATYYNENIEPKSTLSKAIEKSIKKTYRFNIIKMPRASLKRIFIIKYYGNYNGVQVVCITDDYNAYDYLILEELSIGGVVFYDIHMASIRIWKEELVSEQ